MSYRQLFGFRDKVYSLAGRLPDAQYANTGTGHVLKISENLWLMSFVTPPETTGYAT